MAMSRISAIAWRRAWRSPRLPSVTSFSTIGRKSFAFGNVVTICSCLMSAAAMLANMARRCSCVRFSLRWALPWRMHVSFGDRIRGRASAIRFSRLIADHRPTNTCSVMILEPLGQLVDIVRRPARHFHSEMQAHLGQHFLDLVERLAPEVRRAQHLGFRLLDEIADINDVVVLETVGGAHAELELVDLFEEGRVEGEIGNCLGRADLFPRLLEVD